MNGWDEAVAWGSIVFGVVLIVVSGVHCAETTTDAAQCSVACGPGKVSRFTFHFENGRQLPDCVCAGAVQP